MLIDHNRLHLVAINLSINLSIKLIQVGTTPKDPPVHTPKTTTLRGNQHESMTQYPDDQLELVQLSPTLDWSWTWQILANHLKTGTNKGNIQQGQDWRVDSGHWTKASDIRQSTCNIQQGQESTVDSRPRQHSTWLHRNNFKNLHLIWVALEPEQLWTEPLFDLSHGRVGTWTTLNSEIDVQFICNEGRCGRPFQTRPRYICTYCAACPSLYATNCLSGSYLRSQTLTLFV